MANCARCNCRRIRRNQSADPDFCRACVADLELLMDRCRAVRCLGETSRYLDDEAKMYAFLSLFHPQLRHADKLALVADAAGP